MNDCLFECKPCEDATRDWAYLVGRHPDTVGSSPECLEGDEDCICPEESAGSE